MAFLSHLQAVSIFGPGFLFPSSCLIVTGRVLSDAHVILGVGPRVGALLVFWVPD
jgi:hypothetical protein